MTTPPAVYGQFGQALAFSERTMSAVLHDHLAQGGIEPGTWYALKLIATRGPGLSRQDLRRDLEESQNVATASVAGLLSRLETEGLIHGDTCVDLTAQGEARYESLREYVGGPTVRLLSQIALGEIDGLLVGVDVVRRLEGNRRSHHLSGVVDPNNAIGLQQPFLRAVREWRLDAGVLSGDRKVPDRCPT